MQNRFMMGAAALLVSMSLATSVWAGPQVKKYQVTGPITKIETDKVTVQKGEELWEIAIDKDTKVTGEMAVGAKVTIEYQMFATAVSVKAAKAEAAK